MWAHVSAIACHLLTGLGLRFSQTNNFTVSGNPISASLSCFKSLSSDFFANIFDQNFLLTKWIIVLHDLPRRWHASISDSWISMSIFPKSFSSLFLTLYGMLATTTLLQLHWSFLFQIILKLSNWVTEVLTVFFFFNYIFFI